MPTHGSVMARADGTGSAAAVAAAVSLALWLAALAAWWMLVAALAVQVAFIAGLASYSVALVALGAAVVVGELGPSARHSLAQAVSMMFRARRLLLAIGAASHSLALAAGDPARRAQATPIAEAVGN